MKIEIVTMTGANDLTDPSDLIKLSTEYPFVEWGILLSASSEGSSRFPTAEWMRQFKQLRGELRQGSSIKVAGHLCGKWLRDLLRGDFAFAHEDIWPMFDRVQLNFHGGPTNANIEAFINVLRKYPKFYIFQDDNVNTNLCSVALERGINAGALFDLSHGAGVLPEYWPKPRFEKTGYAGGLGPDNLAEQLECINKAVGNRTIWIDMETKVRSDWDRVFDLDKVRTCLEIAKPYVV